MTIRVGIIGAGLMGQKRAANLKQARLVAVADNQPVRAIELAEQYGASAEKEWWRVIRRPDVDAVLVCTPHDTLVSCAVAALAAGKHVLVEKPAGRNPSEVKKLFEAASRSRKVLRVGFNHRFHPAFQK